MSPPSVKKFAELTDGACTAKEILSKENVIFEVKIVDFSHLPKIQLYFGN